MKRLIDERDASDPNVQAAARLLTARGPLGDDMLRRQRVRARIRRRRPQSARATWLRRAVLLTLLAGGAAAASPGIARVARQVHARIVAARLEREQTRADATHRHRERLTKRAAQPTDDDEPLLSAAAAPPAVATTSTDAPTTSAPSFDVPAPVTPAPSAPVATPTTHAATTTRLTTRGARERAFDAVDDERQQLLAAAVRALRHEQSPARAQRMLTRYLDRYPDSAAAEDALALAIEATVDRDPPRATAFARRYLSRYPSGRWAQLAQDALRR